MANSQFMSFKQSLVIARVCHFLQCDITSSLRRLPRKQKTIYQIHLLSALLIFLVLIWHTNANFYLTGCYTIQLSGISCCKKNYLGFQINTFLFPYLSLEIVLPTYVQSISELNTECLTNSMVKFVNVGKTAKILAKFIAI